ncbi:ParB/RepB/Spo0J family partition protein [Streptomyces sp. NPDC058739]|uniref:ParB/RepB/Spo0J family partition protein n=1 Tax=Streptomyces sp. NPDC058739 TaxID=3346618 RepID=UPI003697F352
MSKADTLGPAPSFGAVRSARRQAINKIGGEDTTAAITELPVSVISENPGNPRNHLRNLDETVESVRAVGVILPIVVGTAEAYLRDRPGQADDLEEGAQYVVIDGHRRLEAARRVGLATIPVRVDNARLATDETLLEAAFVANYHRDDMTDLEEAHALQQLVEYYGSQTKASKRLGIPQGTISSKLSLLKLSPELQKDLQTGERTVEHVRNLGKLQPDEQKQKADERREAARRKGETPQTPAAPSEGSTDYHGVISHGTVTAAGVGPDSVPASGRSRHESQLPSADEPVQSSTAQEASVPAGGAPETTAAVPVPAQATMSQPRQVPYDQPGALAMLLHNKMPDDDDFFALWEFLGVRARERNPERVREIAERFLDTVVEQAE